MILVFENVVARTQKGLIRSANCSNGICIDEAHLGFIYKELVEDYDELLAYLVDRCDGD